MMFGLVVLLSLGASAFSTAQSINNIPKDLLSGAYTLVDLTVNSLMEANDSYSAQATFCRVDWTVHQANPSLVSFFDDLRNHSCSEEVEVDLWDFVKAARNLDAATASHSRLSSSSATAAATNIAPTGVVFHESRCGSTLAANMLAAFDPPSTRVYSEHFPAIDALRACAGKDEDSCPTAVHQQLIQDVFFTLGRVPADSSVKQVFFKTNSGGMFISHFTRAFPNTPWIYMYRDSQEIMQSHFKMSEQEILQLRDNDNKTVEVDVPCARNQKKEMQPPAILKVLHRHNVTNVSTLSMTEYCAAHLASITHSVLMEYYKSTHTHNTTATTGGIKTTTNNKGGGRFVNYKQMPAIMYESIVPHHFGIPLSSDMQKRMQAVTNMYSKGGKRKSSDVSATWSAPPPPPAAAAAAAGPHGGEQQQPHSSPPLASRPAVPLEIANAVARYCPDTYAQLEAVRIRQEEQQQEEEEAETVLILRKKQEEKGRSSTKTMSSSSSSTKDNADAGGSTAKKARLMGWAELLTFTVQVCFCWEYMKKETLYEFVATKWQRWRLQAVSYWL